MTGPCPPTFIAHSDGTAHSMFTSVVPRLIQGPSFRECFHFGIYDVKSAQADLNLTIYPALFLAPLDRGGNPDLSKVFCIFASQVIKEQSQPERISMRFEGGVTVDTSDIKVQTDTHTYVPINTLTSGERDVALIELMQSNRAVSLVYKSTRPTVVLHPLEKTCLKPDPGFYKYATSLREI